MRTLSPVDASFLKMESRRTPMHVGALLVFQLPQSAAPDFLRDFWEQMRTQPFLPAPFDSRIKAASVRRPLPVWEKINYDIDYHLRHSALPYPGGERELGVLVARLHSHPMDMTRPLWECHLIEGLENNRFALYFKAHHCAIDGMAAVSMIRDWLSEDPTDMSGPTTGDRPVAAPRASAPRSLRARLTQPVSFAGQQISSACELVRALRDMTVPGTDSGINAARATPRSLFNVPVSQQRRLGTQLLDLPRVKAIAKAAHCTVNDVLLSLCGSAMRRYLLEHGALPTHSLMASVPVGLPRAEGQSGNAVAGFVCPLGTDIEDPVRRLRNVHDIATLSKEKLRAMSPSALTQFTLLGLSPLILGQMTGTLSKFPPFFNVTVSNVVASKTPLFLRGALLEAIYPMSILFDGYALNVTLVGYGDSVAVGFTGCRDAIPSLQRLAVYTGEALPELERAVGLKSPRAAAVKKSGKPGKKTARKAATKPVGKAPAKTAKKVKQAVLRSGARKGASS